MLPEGSDRGAFPPYVDHSTPGGTTAPTSIRCGTVKIMYD